MLKKLIKGTIIHRFLSKSFLIFRQIFYAYPKFKMDIDYDAYWNERNQKRERELGNLNPYQKKRADVILKHLEDGNSIKDVGCGDATILRYLKNQVKFSQMIGVDYYDRVLDIVRRYGDIKAIKADISKQEDLNNLPVTDYTLILEVLEHMANPEKVLLALLKTTRKKLIFSVPNTGFISHRLRLLFGSFPWQWRLNPGEHLRFWTVRDMRWWLKSLGLEEKSRVELYEGIPVLNKIWPGLFGMGMVVVVEKEG